MLEVTTVPAGGAPQAPPPIGSRSTSAPPKSFPAGADRAPGARALRDGRRALPPRPCAGPGARRGRRRSGAARPRRARARARPARGGRAGAAGERARTRRARAPRARAAAADGTGPAQLQVRAAARQGPRPGRVRGLGGPPAARPDRHARRLVAAQAVVRLSVSQGVAVHARPRFTEVSIAASVRR